MNSPTALTGGLLFYCREVQNETNLFFGVSSVYVRLLQPHKRNGTNGLF